MAPCTLCKVDGCDKQAIARGWCRHHYDKWKRPRKSEADRSAEFRLNYLSDTVMSYEGRDCLIWPFGRDGKGYGRLSIKGRSYIVSRMVCREVHGEPPTPQHEAAHSCGKGHEGCVNPHHLSWKTRLENKADSIAHGTHVRGHKHRLAKLTEDKVRLIRSEITRGQKQSVIAQKYGVSRGTISDVSSGRHWGWLV